VPGSNLGDGPVGVFGDEGGVAVDGDCLQWFAVVAGGVRGVDGGAGKWGNRDVRPEPAKAGTTIPGD
jgi:hypothetical protein